MKLEEVIRHVAQDVGISQSKVRAVLNSYAELVKSTVAEGKEEHIPFSDIGRFKVKAKRQRTVYNPQTREYMDVEYGKLQFAPSRKIRSLLRQ